MDKNILKWLKNTRNNDAEFFLFRNVVGKCLCLIRTTRYHSFAVLIIGMVVGSCCMTIFAGTNNNMKS